MLGNLWTSAYLSAKRLGINQDELTLLREKGFLKPGLHWKSSPYGQKKPWNPEAIYNVNLCREVIDSKNIVKSFDDYAA